MVSITPNPTIEQSTVVDDGLGMAGGTNLTLNLEQNSTYYYRAFARNSQGTVYGGSYSIETVNFIDNDDDDDGVLNDVDECPNTSAGEIVNAAGCSESQLDDDSDGVMNNVDNCPNTSNPNQEDLDGDDIGDVCDDDIDGDNIMNDVDICSDTPIGVSVDANGCILLAADNFEIETISETCPNKNNGQLIITANESRDYKLTINGNSQSFNSNVTIDNLSHGAYEICIEVVGITSPYCYVVEIEAGTTISGKSSLNNKQLQVEVTEGTLP